MHCCLPMGSARFNSSCSCVAITWIANLLASRKWAVCSLVCLPGILATLAWFSHSTDSYFQIQHQSLPLSPVDASKTCVGTECTNHSEPNKYYHELGVLTPSETRLKFESHGYVHKSEGGVLTILGTSTKFDSQRCPSDSLAANPGRMNSMVPEHRDACPTAFIVGARKGGTTSLYQYLSKHPNFTGVNLKRGPQAGETFFFERGGMNWKAYRSLFPTDGTMSGDSSVGNLVKCQVPRMIFKGCGRKAKIIMLLRNPTDRFISNYMMRVRLGSTKKTPAETFSKEIEGFSRQIAMRLGATAQSYSYADHWEKLLCLYGQAQNMVFEGLYYVHVLNWLCNFPPENILIVNSEEFFENPTLILRDVIKFLGLQELDEATLESFTSTVYNKGTYDRISSKFKASTFDKEKLSKVYERYNGPVVDLLNWKGKVTWN